MKNLNIRLAELQAKIESGDGYYRFNSDQLKVMETFEQNIIDSGILDTVVKPGQKFPNFVLANQYGESISLHQLLIRGPVVVNFFRGIWCPYCNLELQALQQSLEDIEATGATLVAISPQRPAVSKQSLYQNGLRFDLLSDIGNALASKIGITYQLEKEIIEKVYRKIGIDLAVFNGDEQWQLPVTSRFIIDSDSTVVSASAAVNHRKRPDPRETIAILRAITRRASY